jgi:hypothetical protein
MAITGSAYVKRSEFKLFLDVSATATPDWELIGDKVEELNLELNPNVTTVTDVTGNTTTILDKYESQSSVDPMRAKRGSKIFEILYDIVKNEKTLSDVEKTFLCVNIFDESDGKYAAWTQKGVIAVQSYGGGTEGLNIPYNVHWTGQKTHGTFDPAANTFTAGTGATYLVTFSVSGTAAARLAGAQLLVNGEVLTTDANGIAAVQLPAGTYAYTATADGYDNGTGSITVSTAAVYEAVSLTETT